MPRTERCGAISLFCFAFFRGKIGGEDLFQQQGAHIRGEGEVDGDPDEYTIDILPVPFKELTAEILEFSDLEHLIPPIE